MRGGDTTRTDFTDFILGMSREIWEERGLAAKLRDYHARDVILRSPAGIAGGEAAAARATLAHLQEFPDRVPMGEDVIWCGGPEAGVLSSARMLSVATHRGAGVFGAATGRRVAWRMIADAFVRDGRIAEEWSVQDTGAILRALDQDPRDWAAAQIEAEGGPDRAPWPFTPVSDIAGPYAGRGNDNAWGERLHDLLARMMAAEFSAVAAIYDRACALDYAGGITAHGPSGAERFWLPLRASFPSSRFEVHHVMGREDALMPPRAALRWSLWGRHDGWGPFGAPTGAEVYVMGITHAEFGPRGLRREWTLYDEAAVWKQILLATG